MLLVRHIAGVARKGLSRISWAAMVTAILVSLALSPAMAGKSFGGNTHGSLAATWQIDPAVADTGLSPSVLCASYLGCTAVATPLVAMNIGGLAALPILVRGIPPAHGLQPTPDNPPPI